MSGLSRDVTERRQADEALRQSQAQLRTLVEQAPVCIAMFDRRMDSIAASRRRVADYGRGRGDLVGRNHYEIHPDIQAEWKRVHREALAGAFLKNDRDLWTQADGSRHWLRWAVHPWTDQGEPSAGSSSPPRTSPRANWPRRPGLRKDGTRFPMYLSVGEVQFPGFHGFIGVAHDLTEQKTAQRALAVARGYLQDIIDSMPSMLAGLDVEGRITPIGLFPDPELESAEVDLPPGCTLTLCSDGVLEALPEGALDQCLGRLLEHANGGSAVTAEALVQRLRLDTGQAYPDDIAFTILRREVLIVDDDELVRENLIGYLQDEGMQVTGVASGEEAVALLRAGQRFDVCVMDMRLPGMDGNDSMRAVHAMAPGLEFLIHTGSAAYSLPADLRALGLDRSRVFFKPLQDMGPLAQAIRDLAGRCGLTEGPC
jgi:PAS domain S-box-containing protein